MPISMVEAEFSISFPAVLRLESDAFLRHELIGADVAAGAGGAWVAFDVGRRRTGASTGVDER